MPRLLRFFLAASALTALAAAPQTSHGDVRVGIRPVPSWVDLAPLDTIQARESAASITCLVSDYQVNRIADPPEEMEREAYRVGSQPGAEACSRVTADFDPSYQSLDFHFVRILRGGQIIDCLPGTPIQILRREPNLEQSLIGGQRTALILLADVRVGDIVEYAYTIRGRQPTLGRNYCAAYHLQYDTPVKHLWRRLLWPRGQPIRFRSFATDLAPISRSRPDGTEYEWSRAFVEPLQEESDAPEWFDPQPRVQMTTFASWNQVAQWGTELFRAPATLSPALRSKIEEFRKQSSASREQAVAAIRFVQDEIRYQGIEIGEGSLRPAPPDVVLARRYGDCKDKTLLLVTLLRGLGVAADVALVNAEAGRELPDVLPSALVFDHAVVRVAQGPCWVDATNRQQRGGWLTDLAQPDYGWALLLRSDTKDLMRMDGKGPETTTSIEKTYSVGELREQAILDVKSTYLGGAADHYRQTQVPKGREQLTEFGRKYYATCYPKILATHDIEIWDDQNADEIVTHEQFRIPGFWGPSVDSLLHVGEFSPQELIEVVPDQPIAERHSPFYLDHPLHVVYDARLSLPRGVHIHPKATRIENEFFRFHCVNAQSGREASLHYEYVSLKDEVPLTEVARFEHDRESMLSFLNATSTYEARTGWLGWPSLFNLPALLLLLLSVAGAVVLARRVHGWRPAYVTPGVLGWREPPPAEAEVAPVVDEEWAGEAVQPELFENPGELPEDPIEEEEWEAPEEKEWIEGQPIGGWLWLLGLGLVMTNLRLLWSSHTWAYEISLEAWIILSRPGTHPLLPVIRLYEPCVNAVFTVAYILLLVLFFERRKTFPRVFTGVLVLQLLFWFVDLALALPIPTFRETAATRSILNLFQLVGFGAIWLPYLHRSRRAHATFVN